MLSYLSWHYKSKLNRIFTIWNNFLIFSYHYFSVPELLRSLFSPWKKQAVASSHIFPLNQFFEAVTFNMVSRSIGFLIRTVTLWMALILILLVIVAGFIGVCLWLAIPVLTFPLFLWENRPAQASRIKHSSHTMRELVTALFKTEEGLFIRERLELQSNEIKSFLSSALDAAPDSATEANTISDLFSLATRWQAFADWLKEHKLQPADVVAVGQWYERREAETKRKQAFWELENLMRIPGIGQNWTYGYTPRLEQYTTPLSIEANPLGELVGREQEIAKIEEILAKTTHNSVVVTGDAGIGKQPIIETLATKIAQGTVYLSLRHKRLLLLSLPQILKDTELSSVAMRGFLHLLFQEAEGAGNLILVIFDIDRYLCAGEQLNLAEEIVPVLRDGRLQIIATSLRQHYHECIASDQELASLFENVDIAEPAPASVLITLTAIVPLFESKQKVFITYQALKEIVDQGHKLLPEVPFPQKAIDLLDKTIVHGKTHSQRIISSKHVDEVLTGMTHIPLGIIHQDERQKLLQLESLLHGRIVGQDEAISAISQALRRGRLEINNETRPIGAFLFLGPTGVGKTETAKAMASIYFGDENKMIRFDMSQFQDTASLYRLIGTHDKAGQLTSQVKDNPFSVILLDEFEKAAKEIHNLFLTVFDEGYISAGDGKKVYFNHTLIIATSNAGASFIHKKMQTGQTPEQIKAQLIETIISEGIFMPELVNRFDAVIVYKPLTPAELLLIAHNEIARLNTRLQNQYDIVLNTNDAFLADIVKDGYDPAFGARPMKRVIAEKVEDVIAHKLLSGEIKRGQTISADVLI